MLLSSSKAHLKQGGKHQMPKSGVQALGTLPDNSQASPTIHPAVPGPAAVCRIQQSSSSLDGGTSLQCPTTKPTAPAAA